MSRDDYIQHAHRHDPKGTDPIDLDAVASGIVQLGGKMPWFQSAYVISGSPALTASDVHIADQFGGTAATLRTTDHPDGYIDVTSAPQVYTDGTFFATDYVTAPEVGVNVLQAGVYYVQAEFLINHYDISAGSPLFASVGVRVQTVAGPTTTDEFADSREISDTLLDDGLDDGSPVDYDGEMAIGRVVAARAVYIGGPSNIQVAYLHEGTLSGGGILLSVFRISDGSGNSAPGSGSGAGIIYDFANTGDWLQVETTGTDPNLVTTSGSSYSNIGISLIANDDIVIGNTAGNVYIDATGTHQENADSYSYNGPGGSNAFWNLGGGYNFNDGPFLYGGSGFEADSTGGVVLSASGAAIELDDFAAAAPGNGLVVYSQNNGVKVTCNGVLVFEIRNNGSVHILSGTSIIADL